MTTLTRPVLLRSQSITAGDTTSDREVCDATALRKPGQATATAAPATRHASQRAGAAAPAPHREATNEPRSIGVGQGSKESR